MIVIQKRGVRSIAWCRRLRHLIGDYKKMKSSAALWEVSLVIFLAFLLVCCGKKSERESILELMNSIGKLAENKDIDNLMKCFTEDYSDFEGRGKDGTREMLEDYFRQYRGIVIHMLGTRIENIITPEASIQTEVTLSSGPAKIFRKLFKYSNDNYRLKMKLFKKEGTWKIRYAEWKYISLDELYPESIAILKKIFPDRE